MRATLFSVAAFVLLATGLTAQAPPMVVLDVVVTTPGAGPAGQLAPADLVVRLDGRVYPVTSIRAQTARTTPSTSVLPAPYGRNDLARGRTLAILIDVPRLPGSRLAAITAGTKSLVGGLQTHDRVALIPLGTDARPVDFTTTHTRIVDAAAQLPLTTLPAAENDKAREAAVDTMIDATGRLAALLGGEEGVKTIVLVTEPFRVNGRLRESMQALGALVARHRIALYIASPSDATRPGDGPHTLASSTGGLVLGASWTRALTEETHRYEVRVTADDRLVAGQSLRTLVASARPTLSIRAMPHTYIRPAGPAALESLTDMLRKGQTFTDLPLRMAAYPVLHTDRTSIRLLIVAETIEPDSRLQWAEFAVVAPDGRFLSQWTEDRAALAQRPLVSGALAPEGTYRLRWAASELTGRRGTVDVDLDVRLTAAGPFRLSALMLGRMANDTFVPVLQPDGDEPTIEWYAEVYGQPTDGQTMTTRVEVRATPTGPILVSNSGRVLTSPDPQRRAMTGQIAMGTLAPGDYEVRATLVINGVDAGHVTRTLHKPAAER